MGELERMSYIHLVEQLEEENRLLKDEVLNLRKLLFDKRYGNREK